MGSAKWAGALHRDVAKLDSVQEQVPGQGQAAMLLSSRCLLKAWEMQRKKAFKDIIHRCLQNFRCIN